eukprot:Awhi_evm1s6823
MAQTENEIIFANTRKNRNFPNQSDNPEDKLNNNTDRMFGKVIKRMRNVNMFNANNKVNDKGNGENNTKKK